VRIESAKQGRNYLQGVVNIAAIACGSARSAGHAVEAALTVPLDINLASRAASRSR
jgi:hypothetical protein